MRDTVPGPKKVVKNLYPKFSDGDPDKLIAALDTGDSWHAVSRKTRILYSTVKKYARALGYEPRERRRSRA
jgi:hypothetical protein